MIIRGIDLLINRWRLFCQRVKRDTLKSGLLSTCVLCYRFNSYVSISLMGGGNSLLLSKSEELILSPTGIGLIFTTHIMYVRIEID